MNESRKTSNEAHESIKPHKPTIESLIRRMLAIGPMTDDQMEHISGLSHQTVSACRRGMVKSGFVEATGEKEKTRSGRKAQVWRLV